MPFEIKQVMSPILLDLADFWDATLHSCQKIVYQISGENSLPFLGYRYLVQTLL